jgi:hypothetical protein
MTTGVGIRGPRISAMVILVEYSAAMPAASAMNTERVQYGHFREAP